MSKRVLLVDDEQMICSVIQDYLEDSDFDVLVAPTLLAARDQIEHARLPDVVVVDMTLPDGSGTALVHELRTNDRTRDIPIILISAHSLQKVENAVSAEDRPDDCILKPFNLREFKTRLERQLHPKP